MIRNDSNGDDGTGNVDLSINITGNVSTVMATTMNNEVTQSTMTADTVAGCVGVDGCIYPDEVIMENGVAFNVRYTGCIEVKTSMKSLDFYSRTQVARECINRVCEAAGLKSVGKRRIDKKIAQYIAEKPCMLNAGTNVIINVSSRALNLINVDTDEIIACHQMPRISFASGGDSDTLDFLAYIAKNEDEWRACYVLECIGGQSEDLILTIGKAFMLRYNALSRKGYRHRYHVQQQNQQQLQTDNYDGTELKENYKEYYNDLPNKLPPDMLDSNDMTPQLHRKQHHHQHHHQQNQHKEEEQQLQSQHSQATSQHKMTQLNLKKPRDRLNSNLIDLNSPPPDQTTNRNNHSGFDSIKDNSLATIVVAQPPDVFDMPTFSLSSEVQRSQLLSEAWYHGVISRPISEALLKNDGDFLVRESQGKHGQYVLTGLASQSPKHLLLIDPEGIVRTKDRIFESISHLINYHWTNALPIISEDSELILQNPVIRSRNSGTKSVQNIQRQYGYRSQHSQIIKQD